MKTRILILSLLMCLALSSAKLVAQPKVQTPATDEQTITDAMADGTQGGRIIALHRLAIATMRKTCDDYRRIKALELSVTLNIPFREAYGNINDVMPILDPIDVKLLRKPVQLPKQIQPHKDEIATVQQQVEMLIELTEKLLLEIEQAKVVIEQHLENQQEIKLEEIVAKEQFDPEEEQKQEQQVQAQQQKQQAKEQSTEEEKKEQEQLDAKDQSLNDLVELAKEDESHFKDVSQAMRQVMAHQQQTQSANVPPMSQLERQEMKAQARNISEGERKELSKLAKPKPEMGTLGRMVTEKGDPTEWLFVDTWYTIGPFPNPSRVNLNRKFPPESVVDLDAVYIGKEGRQIRWQFQQSRDLRVVPIDAEPYGIWYAYSELYFEKDMDLWISIGSDDKANIWVNNLPVWMRFDTLKVWRPNEGYRKVAFKAGRNRILYRVENGWHSMMFSMAIRVAK